MKDSSLVGPLLQSFFAEHLVIHKRVSPRTMESYRDTFRLLLEYARTQSGVEPSALRVSQLDVDLVLAFLDHLERERCNCPRSRNARLAAIRSFFRLVAFRAPEHAGVATRVMAIPSKRFDRRLVGYLTRQEVEAVIAAPDTTTWAGRRDHALLLTLYNTGARVSEVASLRREQIRFAVTTAAVHLEGKGRKERAVPLWAKTTRVLREWMRSPCDARTPVFPSARGAHLTRDGIDYILRQAVARASERQSTLGSKRVTPHVIRHTTAMHLLQSGVDMSVIALWLGHESLETTHMYVEANLATKERALEKLRPVTTAPGRFRPDDTLMAFLKAL